MGLKETTTRPKSRKQHKAINGSQRDNNPTKEQKTAQGHQWDLKRQQPDQRADNSTRPSLGLKETTTLPKNRKQHKAINGSQRDNNLTIEQKTAQGHQWASKRQQPYHRTENSTRPSMGLKETTTRSNSRKQPKAPNWSQRDNNPTKKQKNSTMPSMGLKETTTRPKSRKQHKAITGSQRDYNPTKEKKTAQAINGSQRDNNPIK